jgi:hypothetical protein
MLHVTCFTRCKSITPRSAIKEGMAKARSAIDR